MAVDAQLAAFLPFASYEFVEVSITDYNTPVRVVHSLAPASPYDVQYLVTGKSRECSISDARTEDGAHTEPWTRNYIVLQSTVAPVTVNLLLFIPRRRS
jgi:hypothetical protein